MPPRASSACCWIALLLFALASASCTGSGPVDPTAQPAGSPESARTRPRQERQYWHPHNGEILSGQLVAPGIPAAAEHALMASRMNSYGRTWHSWDASSGGMEGGVDALRGRFGRPTQPIPGVMDERSAPMAR